MSFIGKTFNYRALAGVISSLYFLAIFLLTKTFYGLQDSSGIYWGFAAVSLASNFFYFKWMPETKGKTALEIRQMFREYSLC